MDSPITRAEHEEFCKRMEEEHRRANKRLENLESEFETITDLTISVHELALSVKTMVEEQTKQNEKINKQSERLKKLEGKDGEKWRDIVKQAIGSIVALLIGYVAARMGIV